MKKEKKVTKKLSNKVKSLTMISTLMLGVTLPMAKVFAEEGYVISFTTSGSHILEEDGGHLKIDGQYVDLRDSSDNTIGEVNCPNSTSCTITVSNGTSGSLNYNSAEHFTLFMQGHEFSLDHVFSAREDISVEDYRVPEQNGGPGVGERFDGKAYLIWTCANGGICYHHFENIPSFDDGNSTFYRASEIKDDRTNETFKVDAEYKGWATDNMFEEWINAYKSHKNISEIDWATVNPNDILGDPLDMREYEEQAINAGACTKENTPREDFEHCVDGYVLTKGIWNKRARLQPLPDEPFDNNAYVSYGDRNFKVVIYNDDYKGVSIGDLKDLTYYPAYYTNPFVRQDQYDISGTSESNPTIIDSVLLENTVNIKTLNYNSFNISSIEALDVPKNAVTVSKVNNEWKIVFSSNFYDNVTFKVTDTQGGVEYFKIHRYTLQANLRFIDNKPTIVADFYFDRNKSYTDFEVTAKMIYKDGTTEKITMEAGYGIDDGLGNITNAYEVDEEIDGEFGTHGKGLKKSSFAYQLGNNIGVEENISKVYINVEYKGSTSNNYAGAFAGSDKGIVLDLEDNR